MQNKILYVTSAIISVFLVGFLFILSYSPECEVEDGSSNLVCVWEASQHGNGEGNDFVSLGYGKLVFYK